MLLLGDFIEKGNKTQKSIIKHLYNEYTHSGLCNNLLDNKKVIIAYESVGDWGCDSSSFFLLQDIITKKYYKLHGSHDSTCGFEGQLDLEETNLEALVYRINNVKSIFYTGGYDFKSENNQEVVNKLILKLYKKQVNEYR